MNEVDFIRMQINVEQQHASQVLEWCLESGARLTAAGHIDNDNSYFTRSCIRYLVTFLKRDAARHEAHRGCVRALVRDATTTELSSVLARLNAVAAGADSVAQALDRMVAPSSIAPDTLERDLRLCAQHVSERTELGQALQEFSARHYAIADWRRIAGVDADGILEERRSYEKLVARAAALGLPARIHGQRA
jgi:hypothetical protein